MQERELAGPARQLAGALDRVPPPAALHFTPRRPLTELFWCWLGSELPLTCPLDPLWLQPAPPCSPHGLLTCEPCPAGLAGHDPRFGHSAGSGAPAWLVRGGRQPPPRPLSRPPPRALWARGTRGARPENETSAKADFRWLAEAWVIAGWRSPGERSATPPLGAPHCSPGRSTLLPWALHIAPLGAQRSATCASPDHARLSRCARGGGSQLAARGEGRQALIFIGIAVEKPAENNP